MAPTLRSSKCAMWWSVAALLRPAVAFSQTFPLDETWPNHQRCVELHGQGAFDPWLESSITVALEPQDHEGLVSVVIFELGDEHLGGIVRPGTHEIQKEVLCSKKTAQEGLCNESLLGEFLITDAARTAAKYPMLTRAIDVSKPAPLIYPVRKPGFYCAATFSYSVDKFTGTMRTSEPSSNGPAFKRRLVDIYGYLTPAVLIFSASWICWEAWSGRLGQSKLSLSMVTLTVLETLVRDSQLEESDKTMAAILSASWALMQVVLVAKTTIATSTLARKHGVAWLSLWVMTATTLILTFLWAVWIGVEYAASSIAFGPVYMNLLISTTSCSYFFGLGIAKCSKRQDSKQGMREKVELAFFVLFPGLLFLTVGVANWSIVVRRMDPVDFGKRYWNYRLWLVDAPFEVALPVWAMFTAFLSSLEARRSKLLLESDPQDGEMQDLDKETVMEA